MKHLIIDLETLGIEEKSVVLQVTAAVYDTEKTFEGDILDALQIKNYKVKIAPQIAVGRVVDQETVIWWKQQHEEVQKASLIPNPAIDIEPDVMCDDFALWLKSVGYDKRRDFVWQRGDRDSSWLTSLFRSFGWITDSLPWSWGKVREIRTVVDVLGMSSKLNGYPDDSEKYRKAIPGYKHHDAESDVKFEVLVLHDAGIF